ncbi:MAG: EAL domain-containing protein [Betaproteobacteria bacterium]|nr:EAL domain-containing protein [Betaproteobacteria bacterium]MDE2056480.1 EAL domain-containing protein [Betaproteobacteria bacterium]
MTNAISTNKNYNSGFFEAIVSSSDDAIISITLDGKITTWNPGAEKIFGYRAEDIIGCSTMVLIPKERQYEEQEILSKISLGERISHFETIRKRKDGRYINVSVTISPIFDEQGKIVGASKIARDITNQKKIEAELKENESRLNSIFDTTPDAIIVCNSDKIIKMANQQVEKLLGYSVTEIIGKSLEDVIPEEIQDLFFESTHQNSLLDNILSKTSERLTIKVKTKDNIKREVEINVSRIKNEIYDYLACSLRDIEERKKIEQELIQRAMHDPLTGLPNRIFIQERLTNVLKYSQKNGSLVAILFIDLDGFKPINDLYGHETGDEVLKIISNRLAEQVRPSDTVARLSGDEFVILFEQVDQPSSLSALAERINTVLRRPIETEGRVLFLSASIGIALGNCNTQNADELLRQADTAMYSVKEKGRDSWAFFNENLQKLAQKRLEIINGLRLAIENNELSIRFQPIVESESGRIVSAELLLRWHLLGEEITPSQFIPIAESSRIILEIGIWVFRAACQAEKEWRIKWGDKAPTVSVNLSVRQLSDVTLVDEFSSIIHEFDANPNRILLEITETSLMTDIENNILVLRQLSALGLRIAIDDFGTGNSSLAQLTRLPISVLKIDRIFIEELDNSDESRSIIRAIIGLGHSLDLKLIAEGVETGNQRLRLCAYGCDFIQGYFFHKPLMINDFTKVVSNQLLITTSAETTLLLYALIYVSKASQTMTKTELMTLQKQTINNNLDSGISGCLLYREGEFMQLIEGQRQQVLALYDRIKSDPRHIDCKIILESPVTNRAFRDWGMVMHYTTESLTIDQMSIDETVSLFDLAKDPNFCYDFITSFTRKKEY